jgi:hypothetical protein
MIHRTKDKSDAHKKYKVATVPATEELFKELGGGIMRHDPAGRSERGVSKRWLSFFGVEPSV